MSICYFIRSYNHPVNGRVSLFQRSTGGFLYELARNSRHLRWFHEMSCEQVHDYLLSCDYIPE